MVQSVLRSIISDIPDTNHNTKEKSGISPNPVESAWQSNYGHFPLSETFPSVHPKQKRVALGAALYDETKRFPAMAGMPPFPQFPTPNTDIVGIVQQSVNIFTLLR